MSVIDLESAKFMRLLWKIYKFFFELPTVFIDMKFDQFYVYKYSDYWLLLGNQHSQVSNYICNFQILVIKPKIYFMYTKFNKVNINIIYLSFIFERNSANVIKIASSVLIVLEPWFGQVFKYTSNKVDGFSSSILWSASNAASSPWTPPKQISACLKLPSWLCCISSTSTPLSDVPIFKSYPPGYGHLVNTSFIDSAFLTV